MYIEYILTMKLGNLDEEIPYSFYIFLDVLYVIQYNVAHGYMVGYG